MRSLELVYLFLMLAVVDSYRLLGPARIKQCMAAATAVLVGTFGGGPLMVPILQPPIPVCAKSDEEPIPLKRYFDAVRKELDPKEGESLRRIKKDIDDANWDDLKTFTREYDAGFRGGVLKATWKQLGDNKKRGIEISNSFTFDLIGLNQAARKGDAADAIKRYQDVQQDMRDFLTLEP